MKHTLNCPGCGETMLTIEWDDRSPYVRRALGEIRAAAKRAGRGKPGRETEDQILGEIVGAEQARRLARHPERHEHHCGAVVQIDGDPSAPFGRRATTLRGRRPDAPWTPPGRDASSVARDTTKQPPKESTP